MQITHKFLDDFTAKILECDKGVRLGKKWAPWQTESSLRPIHQLLKGAIDSGTDLPWSEVEQALAKIPADKRVKYRAALDVLESKKAKWDFLKNKVSGFGKFGAADFKEDITIPGRGASLLVRSEGLAPGEMREIIVNLIKLCPLIHQLASNSKLGPRRDWFAQASLPEVDTALQNLDKYLNTRCTRLTFKRVHVGMRCDSNVTDPNDLVTSGLAGQVIPTVMLKGEDRPDYRKPDAYLKVPSGLKIFIGPLYFSVRDKYDAILNTPAIYRFMTLAHELTHKIIKTSDKVYELPNCRAIKDSPDGVMCADSWGYFLTAYANTPDYALRHGAQQRRAAMGYDDD
jgi:hypothetical protein